MNDAASRKAGGVFVLKLMAGYTVPNRLLGLGVTLGNVVMVWTAPKRGI